MHASDARQRQLTREIRPERALDDTARLPRGRPARAAVPGGYSTGDIHAEISLEGNGRFDATVVTPALRGGECAPL